MATLLEKVKAQTGKLNPDVTLPPAANAQEQIAKRKRDLIQVAAGELGSVDELRRSLQAQVASGELTQEQADVAIANYLEAPGTARARTE